MPKAYPFGTNPSNMGTMNPEEEITNMLELLEELLEGIDQIPDADDIGPAGECSRLGAQSTGSLRSPGWLSETNSTSRPSNMSFKTRIGRAASAQNVQRCGYFRAPTSASGRGRQC